MPKLAVNGGERVRTKPWPRWPVWDEREIKALEKVVRSGHWGRLYENSTVEKFEKAFAAYQDAEFGIAVTSGTAALTIALKAGGIDVGDEVIVPGYTFIATATCAIYNNAVPIFVDVEMDTINIDPAEIEKAITPRTRAIIPVHWNGRAADMDSILDIAKRHNLLVVEDACHGWGATWKDRKVGAIGDMGGVSFQASKHITAGEGGIILTNDEELAAKCFFLPSHRAHTRPAVLRASSGRMELPYDGVRCCRAHGATGTAGGTDPAAGRQREIPLRAVERNRGDQPPTP